MGSEGSRVVMILISRLCREEGGILERRSSVSTWVESLDCSLGEYFRLPRGVLAVEARLQAGIGGGGMSSASVTAQRPIELLIGRCDPFCGFEDGA
jgi:hypothetical protein